MIHVRGEGVLGVAGAAVVAGDDVAEVVLLDVDARDLRELDEDLRAHGVLVKWRGRLGEDRAGEVEKSGGVHEEVTNEK